MSITNFNKETAVDAVSWNKPTFEELSEKEKLWLLTTVRMPYPFPALDAQENPFAYLFLEESEATNVLTSTSMDAELKELSGSELKVIFTDWIRLGINRLRLITGNGTFDYEVDKLLGLEDRVKYTGELLNSKLIRFMQYRNSTHYNEEKYQVAAKFYWNNLINEIGQCLFFVPVIYEDESPTDSFDDKTLHLNVESSAYITETKKEEDGTLSIVLGNGEKYQIYDGADYDFAKEKNDKKLRMVTICSKITNNLSIPIFTDFKELKYLFPNSRIQITTFNTFDIPDLFGETVGGVVINPITMDLTLNREFIHQISTAMSTAPATPKETTKEKGLLRRIFSKK